MLWQVRTLLEDRPGALAALSVGCGDQLVNILGLQIFPAPDGRVVDWPTAERASATCLRIACACS